MICDTGMDNILRSWLVLDNHDTERLANVLEARELRRMARVLQFTLPGSPCVYYGTEVDMEGGADPLNRAPMRWDLVNEENEDYQWFLKLVEMRKKSRALRVGEWRLLDCDTLMGFQRHTDRWHETVVVVANATGLPVTEVVSVRDSKLMNFAPLVDQLSGREVALHSGLIEVEVPPHTAMVLMPVDRAGSDYSPYKRVR
jgi:glycosidase